jgi:hypothetical protein
MKYLVEPGSRVSDRPLYFSVNVVNTGARDIVVSGVQWQVGWLPKAFFVQLTPSDNLNSRVPTKLGPSEEANYFIPEAMFTRNLGRIAAAFQGGWLKRLNNRRVRVGVYLSTGESFLVTPDDSVMKRLRAAPSLPEMESSTN